MHDEEIWLDEAEYEAPPAHRLRKAPVAAAIAAAATLALVMAMPRSWIERAVYELYVDSLIPAAKLPLGDMAHAVVAFVAAAIVAITAFAIARFVDFGKLLRRGERAVPAADEGEAASPRLRRADSHPDAPPRAPFRVGAGFDENEDADEDFTVENAEDPAAMADDDADDEMFDLGGFEAGDEDALDQPSELDESSAPAIFDVGAMQMPDETWSEDAPEASFDDAEPLVSREVADDPMADVREKFADMFGPGEEPEGQDSERRSDLSDLTTGQLIDELERRIAARNRDYAADPTASEPEETPVAATERAANDQHDDDTADDIDGGELDDMDAALQAALGTLARMQKSSAG